MIASGTITKKTETKKSEKKMDEFFADYIDMLKTTMDAYAEIVEKMMEFQQKNKDDYEKIIRLIEKPDAVFELAEKMRKIDKDIFFRFLEIMFIASRLEEKVRKVYFMTIKEKKELASELRTTTTKLKNIFEEVKKIASQREEIK